MNRWTALLAGAAVAIAAPAAAQDAAGDWFGVLEVSPQAKLPLVGSTRTSASACSATCSAAQPGRTTPRCCGNGLPDRLA
jgi:hypothetical protein